MKVRAGNIKTNHSVTATGRFLSVYFFRRGKKREMEKLRACPRKANEFKVEHVPMEAIPKISRV